MPFVTIECQYSIESHKLSTHATIHTRKVHVEAQCRVCVYVACVCHSNAHVSSRTHTVSSRHYTHTKNTLKKTPTRIKVINPHHANHHLLIISQHQPDVAYQTLTRDYRVATTHTQPEKLLHFVLIPCKVMRTYRVMRSKFDSRIFT